MSQASATKYVAFLSYSHRDKAIGEAIHSQLENYRIPADLIGQPGRYGAVPSKLRPIFRDRYDMEAGSSLRSQVTEALANSQALIVLCSPASAKSTYVNEEIRQFKALGRADRIYAIIIDGEPGDPERDCFPPALRHVVDAQGNVTKFTEEPIAADAREHCDGEELAHLKIVAGLLGIDLDRLRRREAEYQKRQKRMWIGITGVMAALAVLAIGVGIVAKREAEQKKLALTKNEELLDATLRRTSSLVTNSISSVRRSGLPAQLGLKILKEAEGFFDDMDEINVTSSQLPLRRAEMLIGIAQSQRQLGHGEESLTYAFNARAILLSEIKRREKAGEAVEPNLYFQVGRANINLARAQIDRRWYEFGRVSCQKGLGVIDQHLGGMSTTESSYLELRADLLMELAQYHFKLHQWDGALSFLGKARAVATRLGDLGYTKERARTDAVAAVKLADISRSRNDLPQAISATKEAEELIRVAIRLHPKDLSWRGRLHGALIVHGDIARAQSHKDEALEAFRESEKVIAEGYLRDPQNADVATQYALSNLKIFEVANEMNDFAVSEDAASKAIKTYRFLLAMDPTSQRIANTYLHTLEALGEMQRKLGKREEMAKTHEEALELSQKLLASGSVDPALLRHAAEAAFMSGEAYRMLGKVKLARERYDTALQYRQRQIEAGAGSTSVRFERAWAMVSKGHTYQDRKEYGLALPFYVQAYELMEPLASDLSPNGWSRSRYIATVESIARVYSELDEPERAKPWFEKVQILRELRVSASPTDSHRREMAHTQEMVADNWIRLGDIDKALALYNQSLPTRRALHEEKLEDPQRRRNLANTQRRLGEINLTKKNCTTAHDFFDAAEKNLVRAIAEYEEKTGEPKANWSEQLNELTAIALKAGTDCPRSATPANTPSTSSTTSNNENVPSQ